MNPPHQTSSLSDATTSYARPYVTAFDEVASTSLQTDGSLVVTVTGRNFGVVDEINEVSGVYHNAKLADLAGKAYAAGKAAAAAAAAGGGASSSGSSSAAPADATGKKRPSQLSQSKLPVTKQAKQ